MHTSDESQPLLDRPIRNNVSKNRNVPFLSTPYLLMLTSALFVALMMFLIHLAENRFHLHRNSAFSICGVTTVPLALFLLFVQDRSHTFNLSKIQCVLLILRGILGAQGTYLLYSSLAYITPGTTNTLFNTTPTITSLFCTIFLGEKFTKNLVLVLILNIAGVSLVSRPALELSKDAVIGIVQTLLAATSTSAAFVFVKLMGTQVHFAHNLLAYGLACALIAVVTTTPKQWEELLINPIGTGVALAGAIAGFVGKGALNHALPLCPGGYGMVVRTSTVPMAYLLGMVFSKESLTVQGVIGVLFVLASVVVIALKPF